jgi:hypothetical protein
MATPDGGGPGLDTGDEEGEVDVRALAAEVKRIRTRQDQLLHRLSTIGGFVSSELDGLRPD